MSDEAPMGQQHTDGLCYQQAKPERQTQRFAGFYCEAPEGQQIKPKRQAMACRSLLRGGGSAGQARASSTRLAGFYCEALMGRKTRRGKGMAAYIHNSNNHLPNC